MDLQNFYKAIGVNYNTVLRRLRREDLIEKYLKLFLKDQTFILLAEAKENGDYQQLFGAAHTIKGLALNLELSPLADAASSLTLSRWNLKEPLSAVPVCTISVLWKN